mgnify:CR=1 FL=1
MPASMKQAIMKIPRGAVAMLIPASLAVFSAAVPQTPALAQAADEPLRSVSCKFEDDDMDDLGLVLEDRNKRKSRFRTAPMTAIVDKKLESSAIAQYVSPANSGMDTAFMRVVLRVGEDLGLAVQIAGNGDAIVFPYNISQRRVSDKTGALGRCKRAEEMMNSWK